MVIGIVAGGGCYWACTMLKLWLGYDDSLDVSGVHGVGGIIGTLLAGVFATATVSIGPDSPQGLPGLIDGNPAPGTDPIGRHRRDGRLGRRSDLRDPQAGQRFDRVARAPGGGRWVST